MTRFGLSTKYALLIAGLVSLALMVGGALGLYFFARENLSQLSELHREKASTAATRIESYVRDIEHDMVWTTLPQSDGGAASVEQRRWEYLKLLRQAPAITTLRWLDGQGRERLRVSRLYADRVDDDGVERFDPTFVGTLAPGHPYHGPVHFHQETEPYMTIASAAGEPGEGIVVADVNLKFVWDVVTRIQVGKTGVAYVVDSDGTLIAHPDINLVLQKTTLAALPQVSAVLPRASGTVDQLEGGGRLFVRNLAGQEVLSAHAPIAGLNWHVFVDMPRDEALAPVYVSIRRGVLGLLATVLLAVIASMLLARRMVEPVRALQAGAQAIAAGRLDQRIEVRTGDELEALADEFNTMSNRLKESHGTLELKVEQRTREVMAQRHVAEAANQAKTRFLAAASHDLRQPLHALNLYLGVLTGLEFPPAQRRSLDNVRQCAIAMDDLLDGLLDISRLDANVVRADIRDLSVAPLLERLRMQFMPQAQQKGLSLRVVPCAAWIRSDAVLLERILRNLVSNALRHTVRGKVLVGCRKVGDCLRIAVYDTGPGIPENKQELVFEEFYQLDNPERDRAKGLGLGLSIVRRLAVLLGARVTLVSRPGRGSMFAITLPLSIHGAIGLAEHKSLPSSTGSLKGALIVIVDDEMAVLQATQQLLLQWGCDVVAASAGAQAIEALSGCDRAPAVLLCDYRLRDGQTGLDVIEQLRDEFNRQIPALIVTGDVIPQELQAGRMTDIAVLHKPVPSPLLRDTLERMIGAAQEDAPRSVGDSAIPSRRAARAA